MSDELSPELTDYLIAILYLNTKRGSKCCVRLVEVSELLGVAKPTVSLMIRKLVQQGLVMKKKDGVMLSQRGLERCETIVRKHKVIEEMLISYGLDHDRACDIARKLEVVLGEDDIDVIERNILAARSSCDKLLCRIDSALRARK